MVFGVFGFLQKTNENKSNWGIIVVKANSFVRFFLEEIEDIKNPFEIIWPLDMVVKLSILLYSQYGCWFHLQTPETTTFLGPAVDFKLNFL